MKIPFNENELPVEVLQKIGLFNKAILTLDAEDKNALLSGRRTDLISLTNLKSHDFSISKLDAKLSLSKDESGRVTLNIHPIYKEGRKHALLSELESENLKKGVFTHIKKDVKTPEGQSKTHIVEYDPQTREFVSYDPDDVLVPQKVNGEKLTKAQMESYRHGDIVELSNGARLQHRASEPKGILSDNKALVLSVLLDGGLSYLVLRGIKNLIGSNESQKEGLIQAYEKGQETKSNPSQSEFTSTDHIQQKDQYSRGYGHTASR